MAAVLLFLAPPVLAVLLLVAFGVVIRAVPEAAPQSDIDVSTPGPSAAAVTEIESGTPRPDLEGMSLAEVRGVLKSGEILVFSRTDHAVRIEEASGSVEATITAASESMPPPGTYLLRIDEPSATPSWANKNWWFPEHKQEVRRTGASRCFTCHEPSKCAHCHVERSDE